MTTKYKSAGGCVDVVYRGDVRSTVVQGAGYNKPGHHACELTDTGNGFIAKFPALLACDQDYYVCLSYSQARDLVLAASAFKEELGFDA